MTRKASEAASKKEQGEQKTEPAKVPPWLLVISWLVPGFGHWVLGKRTRALVFAAIVISAFATGVLLHGELGTPQPHHPFSWLATFACLGNGLLYFFRVIWINGLGDVLANLPYGLAGGGDPTAAGFSYGNTFLYTGGLMNLLMILDVADIARGEKE